MPARSPFVFIRFTVPVAPGGDGDRAVPTIDTDPDTIISGSDIVVPEPRVWIVFDFPFDQPMQFRFEADAEEGFTRAHLLRCVQRWYRVLFGLYTEGGRGRIVPYWGWRDGGDEAEPRGPAEYEGVPLEDLRFEGANYVPGSGTVLLVVGG